MGNKKRTVIVVCLMVIFLCLGGFSAYKLYLSYDAYAQGDRAYEKIISQVISEDSSSDNTSKATKQSSDSDTNFDMSEHMVDFSALKAINADSIGWLYCPDTVIDYPVMKADDYTYYLSHLPDGSSNINGSLFLDYACSSDFSDRLSVIYGHSMKSGKMFGTLAQYKNQSYFEKHPYLYLYTEKQNYRIALAYGAVVSANQWIKKGYAYDVDALLEYAQAHTTFVSKQECSSDDKFVVLSTCSYEYSDARYFVIGVLQSD
jgi:sortase B